MSKASDRVVSGFIQLTPQDRQDAITEINRYINAQERDKQQLEESLAKRAGIDLGPMDSGKCPCCGK